MQQASPAPNLEIERSTGQSQRACDTHFLLIWKTSGHAIVVPTCEPLDGTMPSTKAEHNLLTQLMNKQPRIPTHMSVHIDTPEEIYRNRSQNENT